MILIYYSQGQSLCTYVSHHLHPSQLLLLLFIVKQEIFHLCLYGERSSYVSLPTVWQKICLTRAKNGKCQYDSQDPTEYINIINII